MTVKEAQQYGIEKLQALYEEGEASAIIKLVLENIIPAERSPRPQPGIKELNDEEEYRFHSMIGELLTAKPLQYVLHESWFCGLNFYVDENVLIPRPETEELVEWIISNCKFPVDELKILDIGSGSGCIPISLKRRIRKAEVWSCDVSSTALTVAKRNADSLGTAINFIHCDFLDRKSWEQFPSFDIIVSNPPYVPEKDKGQMHPNVLKYEPAAALFVPDNDPLIFYKAIAEFGKTHLTQNGRIYFEIHEDIGKDTTQLLESAGYMTELKKDMQQKDRMIMTSPRLKPRASH